MSDLISREAALKLFQNSCYYTWSPSTIRRSLLALPAVQLDAAAIREIAEGLLSLGDNLTYIAAATDANLHRDAYSLRADVLALIDNPGKEVI